MERRRQTAKQEVVAVKIKLAGKIRHEAFAHGRSRSGGKGANCNRSPIPSIINKPVPLEILEIMDWQSHLTDYDWTDHRWNATQLTNQRSEELAKEGHQQEALVLKLLSSVISMHFVGNVTEPFKPMWQRDNRCSPAPQHLSQLDVQFLQAMARSAKILGLKRGWLMWPALQGRWLA